MARTGAKKGQGARTPSWASLQRSAWARRHPQQAAQERAFRKERAELIADFSHKRNGTPETHHHASRVQQGAVARLYASGRLAIEEVGWAQEIRTVAERIGADVAICTASLETRVDSSRHGDAFWEALGAVRAEVAYSRWRAALGGRAALPLDVIVGDLALTEAARRYRMSTRRAGAVLEASLQLWGAMIRATCRDVSAADLAAAQAGLS
ncbi:hypothetical protein FHS51_001397 [Sphingobium wenxiniae]|uniref:Uncharacterized protein n=1 Tax=Sphingobium wenxiniae (strain DSM 21828 / CGMCC 1.7748 / JZ-1) TaxID=595605 RepID=A0A562KL87_SPHWJ|nr:hypothetical protein [Sphingobium wenxiniae]MBB6191175.1 hypothetical protein [Sphingobium wenxiniae]TWH96025.1 hypothetical protein IQ35_01114 [Sphingobium wenxiniae]